MVHAKVDANVYWIADKVHCASGQLQCFTSPIDLPRPVIRRSSGTRKYRKPHCESNARCILPFNMSITHL